MDYIKGNAYKARVLEMSSSGIDQYNNPAFRYALKNASESEEASRVSAQVDKRIASARRNIARITAAVNGHRELVDELKGYRRYLSSDFLETFARESDKLYEDQEALERVEEDLMQCISETKNYVEEESELLMKWHLENAPPPSQSPLLVSAVTNRNISPKSPPNQNDTIYTVEIPQENTRT